jgi:hypothetical protein
VGLCLRPRQSAIPERLSSTHNKREGMNTNEEGAGRDRSNVLRIGNHKFLMHRNLIGQ